MPTVAELIEQVYDFVTNGRRAASVNTTTTAYSANAAFNLIAFREPTDGLIASSDIVEIDDEQMLVISINHTTKTATMMRGYSGTTVAAHVSDAIAYVQPTMWNRAVRQALIGEITGLTPRLTPVTFYDVGPTSSGQLFYEAVGLTDDSTTIATLGVSLGPFSGDVRAGWSKPRHQFVRNLPTTGIGKAGVLLAENPGGGRELRLAVATRFRTDVFDNATDAIDDVGLDPAWCDIVVYGAAGRMLGRMEAVRAMTDRVTGGDTTKVSQGSRAAGASWFFKRRDELLAHAALEYRGRYPFVEQW